MTSALGGLSRAARRALPFIEAAVARGVSSTALQSDLAAAGMGVRRQDLLQAMRVTRGQDATANRLQNIRRNLLPDPRRIPLAQTDIRRNFSFTVRVDGTDPFTGERISKDITISSDTVLSRDDIAELVEDSIDLSNESTAIEPEDIIIVSAKRRA